MKQELACSWRPRQNQAQAAQQQAYCPLQHSAIQHSTFNIQRSTFEPKGGASQQGVANLLLGSRVLAAHRSPDTWGRLEGLDGKTNGALV